MSHRLLFVLAASLLAACEVAPSEAPESGGDAPADAPAESDPLAEPTQVLGSVTEARSGLPVVDAQVCSLGDFEACTFTDASGSFELSVGSSTFGSEEDLISLIVDKHNFTGTLHVKRRPPVQDRVELVAVRTRDVALLERRLGIPQAPLTGDVLVRAKSAFFGVEGLELISDTDVSEGALYSHEGQLTEKQLGMSEDGIAAEFNVLAGMRSFTLEDVAEARLCAPRWGIVGPQQSVVAPVLPGLITVLDVHCL